jgi:hypothetical protein
MLSDLDSAPILPINATVISSRSGRIVGKPEATHMSVLSPTHQIASTAVRDAGFEPWTWRIWGYAATST